MEADEPSSGDSDEFPDWLRNYRSAAHHLSGDRGHYWEKHDEEPPDYYREEPAVFESVSNENLPPEHQADVPDDWEPSDYKAYYCRICADGCINPVDSPYTESQECRSCYYVPALDDLESSDSRERTPYSEYLESQTGKFPHLPAQND
jgi:hypothetical protein